MTMACAARLVSVPTSSSYLLPCTARPGRPAVLQVRVCA